MMSFLNHLAVAHKDVEQQALAIKSAFVAQLDSLESLSRDEIANDRFEKFRKYRFLYRIINLSIFMLNRYWVYHRIEIH